MDPKSQREGLRLIANGLKFYGSAPSYELITRLVGLLPSEKEAWEVIAEAERIGLIEADEMIVETTPLNKEWRLSKQYDLGKLAIPA